MCTRERLRTTGNPASGQSGTQTREPYCEADALTTRPAWGWGVLFSEVFSWYAFALELVDQYLFPWKGLLLSQGNQGNGKLRRVHFFFFFQGRGGGLGLRDMYVCTQWQGNLQRRESVTEHENGVCESEHLYCTQRFTFSPKCFIPVATVRNETVTLTITNTWMSTPSQL